MSLVWTLIATFLYAEIGVVLLLVLPITIATIAHAYFLLLVGIWILFLSLVIRRLVTLISTQATLLAQAEVSMKQAQSATTAARSLFEQKAKSSDAEEVK
ncbi:B-cell receptor-associated protein 31-like [Hermetia illucens]|uniref:B-cell receptor-associated protein 31-like n=1 Tax=Hermetia illucens TaxID=343691 RepID=UPI0018CC1F28|nr:B-cell receptor-associated protein 31-like [Hermetia illucens]